MTAGSTTRPDRHALPYGQTIILSDYMAGEGKDVTDPMLDVNDFIAIVHHGAGRQALSAARQQFANLLLVPLRLVLQSRLQGKFKAKYGYDLGVP